ncbi:Imm30 family immunity protein [Chitinivorax sp. B]|uniref:Imm30 family immunity protein n=1 Tax=Chitinivorax sp. B TaxID=2502235 RepID=UPI0010F82939|nr:Imm30 family immunity protein [Chitinivorax sp. B]
MDKLVIEDALNELERVVCSTCEVSPVDIDKAISKVAIFKQPCSIGRMLLLLRDDALFEEGMFSLIHAAEAFDDETYIHEMLLILPDLRQKAPAWASVVLMRVLNNDNSRACLTRQTRSSPKAIKDSLIWLLEEINKEELSFLAKTVAPLLAAKS